MWLPRSRPGPPDSERFGIREGVHPDPGQLELADRPIIERLSRRPFRDRVFSTGIKRAYDNTCAISGLRIINGGGRAEALLFKRNAVPGNVHSLVNYARRLTPMFRLREQILNHLTYHIHTHGARPGMIAFRV